MPSRVRVTFLPAGLTAEVAPGTTVLAAAAEAGLLIPAPCGGRGACGRCAVRVESGALAPPDERETAALERAGSPDASLRLACMAVVTGAVSVRTRGATTSPAVRPGGGTGVETAGARMVAAVDLGTTGVSAAVLDASSGARLGVASVPNAQAVRGADVLSRIAYALAGGADELREAAERSVLAALAAAGGGAVTDGAPTFERVVVAGNTGMVSLLAGADTAGLASHPFTHGLPRTGPLTRTPLAEALPGAEILLVPPVAAFVGGDLTAGLIAEGLAEAADGVAYLDIGTNAEVAVFEAGEAWVTSAPAGPAFEGWGISCGGSAGPGGIVAVEWGRPGWRPVVAGGGSAAHLTGSGLLSGVAALRGSGHLAPDGLLGEGGPFAARLFTLPDGVRAFALGGDPAERSVYLSQLDIRAFQYAKAAVRVALEGCVEAAGRRAPIEAYVLAGAFGGALAEEDLIATGVVPREAAGRVRHAGGAALEGAAAIALDPGLLGVAERFSAMVRHVDLAAGASFSERFVAATRLEPYTLERV